MSTIAVAVTAQPANVPPRVKVDITDSGTPAITSVNVVRKDAAGNTTPVRTPDGGPLQLVTSGSTRVGTVFDYEAFYGVAYTYSTVEYPAGVSSSVTLAVADPWLVHLGIPGRSMQVLIQSMSDRTRAVQRGVFQPMGRADSIVITDGRRKNPEGSLQLLTRTDAERVALDTLLSDAGTLLLNLPASKNWGQSSAYVSIGDVTEQRPGRVLSVPDRIWELPYTPVSRPVGGQQATYTYADVQAKYATYQALLDANVTYAAVLSPS